MFYRLKLGKGMFQDCPREGERVREHFIEGIIGCFTNICYLTVLIGIKSTHQGTFPLRSVLSSMLIRMRNGTFSNYANLVIFFFFDKLHICPISFSFSFL